MGTTLALANPSEGSSNKGATSHGNSHSMHYSGHSYAHNYHNWSSWRWDSHHRCYTYFCPTRECSYYWYAPAACYYPVTCMAQFPPTPCSYQQASPGVVPVPVQTAAAVQVTNVNTNTNSLVSGPVAPFTPGILPK